MLPDPPFPDSGHALHFGEAAGEGGLVQRDDLLHGLFWQFLAGCVGQHFAARTFSRLQALSGHTSPLPRASVNNLWEMSNAGDLSADRKKYRRWTTK
jgi:hypothetical protein